VASSFLKQCGLVVNSAKCVTWSIRAQPRQKNTVVEDVRYTINGSEIPALMRDDTLKYLVKTSDLCKLDICVRAHFRKWLALPRDTSVAYIHAAVVDEGLGVPCLRLNIPLQRLNRLRNISEDFNSFEPDDEYTLKQKSVCQDRLRVVEESLKSKTDVSRYLWDKLAKSYDSVNEKMRASNKL